MARTQWQWRCNIPKWFKNNFLRHVKSFLYPFQDPAAVTGNIYFLCLLKPVDENNIEIKACEYEAADCKWMKR